MATKHRESLLGFCWRKIEFLLSLRFLMIISASSRLRCSSSHLFSRAVTVVVRLENKHDVMVRSDENTLNLLIFDFSTAESSLSLRLFVSNSESEISICS